MHREYFFFFFFFQTHRDSWKKRDKISVPAPMGFLTWNRNNEKRYETRARGFIFLLFTSWDYIIVTMRLGTRCNGNYVLRSTLVQRITRKFMKNSSLWAPVELRVIELQASFSPIKHALGKDPPPQVTSSGSKSGPALFQVSGKVDASFFLLITSIAIVKVLMWKKK